MKTNIPERIAALREAMKQHKIDAYIIPTSDPHMSEYPADCWKYREWISGFTGSAGTVIITADKAGLWTDSRYFLQASTQLEGTGIELFKMMLPETPTIPEFLTHELKEGQTVGLNGETYSLADARSLEKALAEKEIKLNTNASLIDPIWKERPAIPEAPMFEMPIELSGKSTEDKLIDINKMLHKAGADCTILSALDEVAWTFNIRGTDVAYNPVVISYAFVSEKERRSDTSRLRHVGNLPVTTAGTDTGVHRQQTNQRSHLQCTAQKQYPDRRNLARQSPEKHQERDRDKRIPQRRPERRHRHDQILLLAGKDA